MQQTISPGQLALAGASFWPVWVWYVERTTDGSDEPLGIVALATLIVLLHFESRLRVDTTRGLAPESPEPALATNTLPGARWRSNWLPIACMVYCCSVMLAPHAVQALLALLILSLIWNTCSNNKFAPGHYLLLGLSLPLVATANFYAGYPLRCVIASSSAWLISLCGVNTTAVGTEVISPTGMVEVDAPCSGIKMLWFCAYLAASLASVWHLRVGTTIALMVVALVAALVGNIFRVSILFFVETNRVPVTEGLKVLAHQSIGLVAFAISAAIVAGVATWFSASCKRGAQCPQSAPYYGNNGSGETKAQATEAAEAEAEAEAVPWCETKPKPSCARPINGNSRTIWTQLTAGLLLLGALLPLLPQQRSVPGSDSTFDWPNTFEGQQLRQLPLSRKQQQFLEGFPGQARLFSSGDQRKIIWRIITKESRQVHQGSDCYRGLGYKVDLKPIEVETNGTRWSRFLATREAQSLDIRETISDSRGKHWTDVSSWYWDAIFKRTQGPWHMITVIDPHTKPPSHTLLERQHDLSWTRHLDAGQLLRSARSLNAQQLN